MWRLNRAGRHRAEVPARYAQGGGGGEERGRGGEKPRWDFWDLTDLAVTTCSTMRCDATRVHVRLLNSINTADANARPQCGRAFGKGRRRRDRKKEPLGTPTTSSTPGQQFVQCLRSRLSRHGPHRRAPEEGRREPAVTTNLGRLTHDACGAAGPASLVKAAA